MTQPSPEQVAAAARAYRDVLIPASEPLEPYNTWQDQTHALENLDAALTRDYWRALGASR